MSDKQVIGIEELRKVILEILDLENNKGVIQGGRKISKGLVNKRVIYYPSLKNKGLLPCESSLEAENCSLMEFNNDIIAFRTQPFTVKIHNNKTYTPDSVQINKDNSIVVTEVKFSGALESESLIEKLSKIRQLFASQSIGFQVITEKVLNKMPGNYNRKFLYRASHLYFNPIQIETVLNWVPPEKSHYKLKSLRLNCCSEGINPLIPEWLIIKGLILFDVNKQLNEDTYIWKTGGVL